MIKTCTAAWSVELDVVRGRPYRHQWFGRIVQVKARPPSVNLPAGSELGGNAGTKIKKKKTKCQVFVKLFLLKFSGLQI